MYVVLSTIVLYCVGSLTLLLGSVFALYTAYLFYVHHKYSHLPSPKRASFFLGHIPDIVRLRRERNFSLRDVVEYWMQQAGSKNIVIFVFHMARIFSADSEVVKIVVMNVKNDKAKIFRQAFGKLYGERFLGNSLGMIGDYDSWKPKRKLYEPAFNRSYLKGLAPNFNLVVDDFLKDLKPKADGSTIVPVKTHLQTFFLDVLSKIIFGTDFMKVKSSSITVPANYSNTFSYIIDTVLNGTANSIISIYPPWTHYFHPLKAKRYQEAVRAFRQLGRDCIENRLKVIKEGLNPPHDILSHILQSATLNESLDMEDLLDEFCNFYIAGYDTSLSMAGFTVIQILQHPEVLSRLLEEIDEVLGEESTVSVDALEKLIYTEQILYESLRMHAPVSGFTKTVDSELTVDDKVVPAHTDYWLMNSVMSRMPDYFENPDAFNPDRFAPGINHSTFSFCPFGAGHRSCLGKQFGMMEAKILVSRLFQTFTLSLPDGYELKEVQKTSLHPKGNIPCTLLPRQKQP